MRVLPIIIALFPAVVLADDVQISSAVSQATLYPYGATITRSAEFEAPAGKHQLIISDLPANTSVHALRIAVDGAKMGAVAVRQNYVPPRDPVETDAQKAAKAQIKQIKAAILAKQDEARSALMAAAGAAARIQYLERLGSGEGSAQVSTDMLRDTGRMIAEEVVAAQQVSLKSEISARAINEAVTELEKDLTKAEAALRALVPEDTPRAYVAIAIEGEAASKGTVTISYLLNDAGWQPVYDMRLTRGETPKLDIARGAFVRQNSGENWQDVNLTLSTVRPSEQFVPGDLWPELRYIEDPASPSPSPTAEMQTMAKMSDEADIGAMAEPILEETVATFDGLSVTYSYPQPVDIASDADMLRLSLGALQATPSIRARAVPLRDTTAFVMAEFTNDTGEIILPSEAAAFYMDGKYVGTQSTPLIANGAEADLSFGPIEGVQIKRTVLNKSEGDRGVISKSNQQIQSVKIEVENLTGESWDVRLLDQVPYSEQDDLTIGWKATPAASETDVDGKRGILAWDFVLPAGETQSIMLDQQIDWPINKMLR